MMAPEFLVAGVLGAALILYVLTGGADFGGGVLDLFASGPRKIQQRRAVALAIGPVWEANHVWLILAIVLMFTCFPVAHAAISTALHIPLTLMLIGVVLRGTAFVFRSYDSRRDDVQARWSVIFAVASTVTPVLLGVVVGAIASGRIRIVDGRYQGDFTSAWLAPFPWAVGLLTLAIFAFLAAVYMTRVTGHDVALQEDFRTRGLWASAAVFGLAWLSFFLARSGAPQIWSGLWSSAVAIPFQVGVGACGLGCIHALYSRHYQRAQVLAILQVVLVVGGWAGSQMPYVVPPDLTLGEHAPDNVLWTVLGILAVGTPPLFAAYMWMMWVFKGPGAPHDPRLPRQETQT